LLLLLITKMREETSDHHLIIFTIFFYRSAFIKKKKIFYFLPRKSFIRLEISHWLKAKVKNFFFLKRSEKVLKISYIYIQFEKKILAMDSNSLQITTFNIVFEEKKRVKI